MRWLREQFLSTRFLKFLLAGGVAATVNFASRFLYSRFLPYEYAVGLAAFTGLICAFVLYKIFVFDRGGHKSKSEIAHFLLVSLAGVAQTWLISILLAQYLLVELLGREVGEALAHLVGIGFPAFTSFLGHKFLTFKH